MTRISFYTFREGLDNDASLIWTCRLIQKIAGLAPVWVYVEPETIDRLDQALWTFDSAAFLAHRRAESIDDDLSRVVLVAATAPPKHPNGDIESCVASQTLDPTVSQKVAPEREADEKAPTDHPITTNATPILADAPGDAVLVNLARALPPEFARFERLADVVAIDADSREAGRVRYRFLRERGYPLTHHVLG